MDIRIDNKFNVVFDYNEIDNNSNRRDLQLVRSFNEQRQRLFIYLKVFRGTLKYDKNWGFDYESFSRIARIGDLDRIRFYFIQIIRDLQIDISSIDVRIQANKIQVDFYFPDETLEIEYEGLL